MKYAKEYDSAALYRLYRLYSIVLLRASFISLTEKFHFDILFFAICDGNTGYIWFKVTAVWLIYEWIFRN